MRHAELIARAKRGDILENNVLHRDSKSFIFTAVSDSPPWWSAGDTIAVKKENGYHAVNNRTLDHFRIMVSHMRCGNLLKLDMQWNYISW